MFGLINREEAQRKACLALDVLGTCAEAKERDETFDGARRDGAVYRVFRLHELGKCPRGRAEFRERGRRAERGGSRWWRERCRCRRGTRARKGRGDALDVVEGSTAGLRHRRNGGRDKRLGRRRGGRGVAFHRYGCRSEVMDWRRLALAGARAWGGIAGAAAVLALRRRRRCRAPCGHGHKAGTHARAALFGVLRARIGELSHGNIPVVRRRRSVEARAHRRHGIPFR